MEERAAIAKLLGLELTADQTLVPRRQDYGAGRDLPKLFERLKALTYDEVLVILSFVTAECLPAQGDMVEMLGAEMQVTLDEDWHPDDTFFDLLRDKVVINAILADIAGKSVAAQHIASTAKTHKAVVKACLSGEREAKDPLWQPR